MEENLTPVRVLVSLQGHCLVASSALPALIKDGRGEEHNLWLCETRYFYMPIAIIVLPSGTTLATHNNTETQTGLGAAVSQAGVSAKSYR